MKQHSGLVLRLYPNAEQREFFAKSFGCVRKVYNEALAHCQAQREAGEKHPSAIDLQKRLPVLKQELPWLAEVDSQALKEACRALDAAFGHFFRRVKNGETPGYPKWKKRNAPSQSFTTTRCQGLDLTGRRIKLPKIGWVRFRGGRPFEGNIKRVTVRMNSAGIYTATALIEREAELPCTPTTGLQPLGIDMGCKTEGDRHQFATLSTGEIIHAPALIKCNARRLARLQRRLAKKQRGSANRKKLVARIAKLHWKIKNQRSDFLHKTTHRLTRENQALAVEDLNVKGMMATPKPKQDERGNYLPNGAARKAGLNRSLASVALGEFFRQLEYKCAWRGVALLKVGRFYPSSKTCSACGAVNAELTLAMRRWRCECGIEHDRDFNSAINIARHAVAA